MSRHGIRRRYCAATGAPPVAPMPFGQAGQTLALQLTRRTDRHGTRCWRRAVGRPSAGRDSLRPKGGQAYAAIRRRRAQPLGGRRPRPFKALDAGSRRTGAASSAAAVGVSKGAQVGRQVGSVDVVSWPTPPESPGSGSPARDHALVVERGRGLRAATTSPAAAGRPPWRTLAVCSACTCRRGVRLPYHRAGVDDHLDVRCCGALSVVHVAQGHCRQQVTMPMRVSGKLGNRRFCARPRTAPALRAARLQAQELLVRCCRRQAACPRRRTAILPRGSWPPNARAAPTIGHRPWGAKSSRPAARRNIASAATQPRRRHVEG